MDRLLDERLRDEREASNVGVWKDSFLSKRWWIRLYRLRNTLVLCEAGGNSDGFDVSLYCISM